MMRLRESPYFRRFASDSGSSLSRRRTHPNAVRKKTFACQVKMLDRRFFLCYNIPRLEGAHGPYHFPSPRRLRLFAHREQARSRRALLQFRPLPCGDRRRKGLFAPEHFRYARKSAASARRVRRKAASLLAPFRAGEGARSARSAAALLSILSGEAPDR